MGAKSILVVGAHADDMELGCGGFVASIIAKGSSVTSLVMTGSPSTDHEGRVWRDNDSASRSSRAAAKVLGGVTVRFLDFDDMAVPYNRKSIHDVNRVIDEIQPDLIITHWVGDSNSDHSNTSRTVITAARRHKNVLSMEPPLSKLNVGGVFPGCVFATFGEDVLAMKLEAIRCHSSEMPRLALGNGFEQHGRRNRLHGSQAGAYAAELFTPIQITWSP